VSDVAATTTSTIDSPTIKQRKIESTVAVKDNETIALGGLIMDNKTTGRSGIPVIEDIPVIGGLFSDTENKKTRTELMVLITPHVVDSLEKARSVTEELKRKLPVVQALFDATR
jgi:general secretion pathway protein D